MPQPHMIREGFVWARNTATNAKEYVPEHWVGSSWFPQYKPLKSAAARRVDLSRKKKNTDSTAEDSAATSPKE